MKNRNVILLIAVMLGLTIQLSANVSLSSIFSSHMVLQQNATITIWGWGKPLEEVKVVADWDNTSYKTITTNQATWEVTLKTPKAGGPYNIKINGYNEIILQDVLIGEVWICSGQSNMEWTARMGIDNAEKEIAAANYPEIRFFSVVHRATNAPAYDVDGSWSKCSPETMIDFSAAAYFFARELQKELNVPIGIINASWGGTPAEVWTPEQSIGGSRFLAEAAEKLPEMSWCPREAGRVYNAMIAPITKFKMAGVIWYQGETNAANPEAYETLMSTLIESWRDAWDEDFPFYFAQIAPYVYGGESGVLVQNAQRKTLRVENTGMVVTNDITADVNNIHPTNKQDVGKRFANLALSNTYNKVEIIASGPLYRSNKVIPGKIIVFFDYAQGLKSATKVIEGFEIAGTDGVFIPADAKIVNNTVEVSSKQLKSPVYVRYAWKNTAQPKLFNGAGLPTSCFTTKE